MRVEQDNRGLRVSGLNMVLYQVRNRPGLELGMQAGVLWVLPGFLPGFLRSLSNSLSTRLLILFDLAKIP